MAARRRTLQDIAENLGISVNTVSRALSDKSGVSDATREKIKAEADRIGYVPNRFARSLVLGTARTIGLVITSPSNPFYADLISHVEKFAYDAGFSIVLFVTDESTEREISAAQIFLDSGLDGAVVVPVQGATNPWEKVARLGIPLVTINRDLEELALDFVATDSEAGVYESVTHLVEQGAQSIVLLEEDLPITTIRSRISGFKQAMSDHGLEITAASIVTVPSRRSDRAVLPWQANEAHRVAGDLLDRRHRPDGFVVGNDYFALGLLKALHDRGLHPGHDVRIVGYGDYAFSDFITPSLSTLRLPARQISQKAIELLVRRITSHEPIAAERHLYPPELVVRDTSRTGRATD